MVTCSIHVTYYENRNWKSDQFWLYFGHRLEDYAYHMISAVQEELEKKGMLGTLSTLARKNGIVFYTIVSGTKVPKQVHRRAFAYLYLSMPESQRKMLHTAFVQDAL